MKNPSGTSIRFPTNENRVARVVDSLGGLLFKFNVKKNNAANDSPATPPPRFRAALKNVHDLEHMLDVAISSSKKEPRPHIAMGMRDVENKHYVKKFGKHEKKEKHDKKIKKDKKYKKDAERARAEEATPDRVVVSKQCADDETLSSDDQTAIYTHAFKSRGVIFYEHEKEFIVKEFRKAEKIKDRSKLKQIVEQIIKDGKATGKLDGASDDIQYFEKVRHFIRQFLKLVEKNDSD